MTTTVGQKWRRVLDRLVSVPVVGLDLGSSTLKAVQVEYVDDRPVLRRCAVAPLDGRDLATVLPHMLAQAGIRTPNVALGLASPEVVVKPFQFPAMPKSEMRQAIQLEAEQAILNGHTAAQTAVDWYLLPGAKDVTRGVLAVVSREVLDSATRAVENAGLRPMVVDVQGLALWNAYWALVESRRAAPRTVLVMNIGARTTNLVVAQGATSLLLVRDVDLGADAFARGQTADWLEDIRDSLSYARSQHGVRSVDAVALTGGGADEQLRDVVHHALGGHVTLWNPLNDLPRDAQSPAVEATVGPVLAVAIGLALRQLA